MILTKGAMEAARIVDEAEEIRGSYDTEMILAVTKTVEKVKSRIGTGWLLPSMIALQTMAVQFYKEKLINDATYDAICDVINPVIEGAAHLQI